jgi:hypothetical protein
MSGPTRRRTEVVRGNFRSRLEISGVRAAFRAVTAPVPGGIYLEKQTGGKVMRRFDGTAARQLDFLDDDPTRLQRRAALPDLPRPRNVRLLQRDLYAELTRRRRRAQIAARHLLEKD